MIAPAKKSVTKIRPKILSNISSELPVEFTTPAAANTKDQVIT